MPEEEGFFKRWSRRKQEVTAAAPVPPAQDDAPPVQELSTLASAKPSAAGEAPPEQASPLTLADTESLTLESDFKPFLARNVAPEVKNAAFKKLFADPHFNVMDRLDIYIDDYSNPAPLPESALRQMASAKFLKLFEEEQQDEAATASPATQVEEAPPSQPVADAASKAQQLASQSHDDPENADLRLQPDDAARAQDARRSAG